MHNVQVYVINNQTTSVILSVQIDAHGTNIYNLVGPL